MAVSPEIPTSSTETMAYTEGCLSIPGVPVEVTRPAEITLRWRDLAGSAQKAAFSGFEAICIRHECDRLDGKPITDAISDAERTEHADRLALPGTGRMPA